MRTWITDTARDLLANPQPGGPLTFDEIAACAGIKTHHLRAYHCSVEAIVADHAAIPAHVDQVRRC
ncbi:hypothetical protein AB0J55_28460 [Amycolatopsis sp. NPDC049688]|uniref:hypothetical protein n=1 Tax=Amycolatopsis sp. NPDC049688 TaxID=3154733 RepID=UPI003415F077